MTRKKILTRFVLPAILLFLLTGLGVVGSVLYGYISTAPPLHTDDLSLDFTTKIFMTSSSGESTELTALHNEKNRVWVNADQVPESLKNAVIAIEDQRFRTHRGVDLKRTAGAMLNYLFKKDSSFGGSTITQQLVKNLTGNNEVSVKRKVQEMWLANRLEKQLGKEKVLELYLNVVYFGEGAYGVQAASYTYFNKDVSALSLAEAASIAGITQTPETYGPFANPTANKQKQEIILTKMLELKMISQAEYQDAAAQPLSFSDRAPSEQTTTGQYSYFVDQVLFDVLADLQKEKGYTRAMAAKLLYTGGLEIHSTVDPSVQEALESVYADDSSFPAEDTPTKANSAMVVTDPYTGEIKGIVGGRGEKTGRLILNRASQSLRQPGSVIKPLAVYAPAVDLGEVTADTIVEDSEITINGWRPENWYNGYRGNVTIRDAIAQSMNVVAVKVLDKVGIERSFNYLKYNFGISTLVDREKRNGQEYTDKVHSALALGGLTDGLSVTEVASAYGAFPNGGYSIKLHAYSTILDHNKTMLIDKQTNVKKQIAIREQTARQMTSMLGTVVERGTGVNARFSTAMPIAGKTGTTSDDKDRWFAGYTPYYVGVVWYGYDIPKSMGGLLEGQSNPAVAVWRKAMGKIHAHLAPKEFFADHVDSSTEKITLQLSEGRIYEGEVRAGKANGAGMMTYPDGNRYVGDFTENMRHGKGILYYAGGNRYEGDFNNDIITGQGTLYWANGDQYSGGWENGKFYGQGTFKWISGDTYSGNWENEKFNGYGIFSWAGGNRYEGEWLNGSFNGYGTFYWANGDQNSGQWQNGKKVE